RALGLLVVMPDGDLMVSAPMSSIGGVAVSNIARWNGVNWSPLGGGLDAAATRLAVLPDGDLVAVGAFTSAGGVHTRHVARRDGVAWHALGGRVTVSGVNANLSAVVGMPDGDVVVGGFATGINGLPANVARWDGSSWSPLGTGVLGAPMLAVMPNGDLVAGGSIPFGFDPSGTPFQAHNLLRWNGTRWLLFGDGLDQQVQALAIATNGDVVVGGQFLSAGASG